MVFFRSWVGFPGPLTFKDPVPHDTNNRLAQQLPQREVLSDLRPDLHNSPRAPHVVHPQGGHINMASCLGTWPHAAHVWNFFYYSKSYLHHPLCSQGQEALPKVRMLPEPRESGEARHYSLLSDELLASFLVTGGSQGSVWTSRGQPGSLIRDAIGRRTTAHGRPLATAWRCTGMKMREARGWT